MLRAIVLDCALILLPATLAAISQSLFNHDINSRDLTAATSEQSSTIDNYNVSCARIAESISSASQLFYPGMLGSHFSTDISHWGNSSSQVSTCSVEPGTPQDVGIILRELALTRTPFAVKGGGHSLNPGFSSTSGVHISLRRMDDIVVHEDSKTVEVGVGLTWIDVYAYLVPKGINVVGGRSGKVGVSGYMLGGGYSWKTNQYGLAVDNVMAFELVLPNGQVKVVTEEDQDLWFALRGGFNNYGIVTKFILGFHEQTDVWAASLNFMGNLIEDAQAAIAKFLTREHDHKAAQQGQFIYTDLCQLIFNLVLFYDGPEPPEGLYDELLQLSAPSKSIFNGSFTDFILGSFLPTYERSGYFDGVPMVRYTQPVIEAYANDTKFWGETLSRLDKKVLVVYSLDPYEPGYISHGEPSAYPPDRSRAFYMSNIYFGWSNNLTDEYTADAIRSSHASLTAAAIKDGQDLTGAAPYPNYALFGTPLEEMYGQHLERLRDIRKVYDPEDIMGLAGGWKF
ncbi:FAD dependent oxidoreductase [Lactifluus subvellereus]|nr:FAD dependent oxidoreductase [Lactifluus subvellereus]